MILTTDKFPAVLGSPVVGVENNTHRIVVGELVYFNQQGVTYGVQTTHQRENSPAFSHYCEAVFVNMESARAYVEQAQAKAKQAAEEAAQPKPTPLERVDRPAAALFFMVVNTTDWQENTAIHPHTSDGWTLPEYARPKHCHSKQELAVKELFRLQQAHPNERFVVLEATLTAEPRQRTEYVCEAVPGSNKDVPF